MADITEPKLNAAPSPTAAYKMTLGSTEHTQDAPEGVKSMVVENHLDMIGQAKITMTATDLNPSQYKIGDEVIIEIAGATKKSFQGHVTSVAHGVERGAEVIIITALDPMVKLANSRATKVWGGSTTDKIKDSVVAKDVIQQGGATAGTVDDTAGERPYIFQRAETNLAFLKRLASRNGYLVFSEEGKIQFKKPQSSDKAVEISQGDVIKVDVQHSDAQIPPKVTVYGWNHMAKKQVKGSFESKSTESFGGGAPADSKTATGEMHIVDVFVDSDATAKAMAEAEMNRLARSLVRGTVSCHLNGSVAPGTKVKLVGQYKDHNAEGLVVSCTHVIEVGGSSSTMIRFVGNTAPQ
ncbi:MAG: phage late control D family protein [Myxococcota bacterium]